MTIFDNMFVTPGILIREINRADLETVTNLTFQLGYASTCVEVEKRIIAIMKHPDHCAYIAEFNHKVAGWIHAFYTIRIESEPFVEIAGLVVDQDFRKMQVGRDLVQKVSSWTLAMGVKTLRVRSNTMRTGAHEFYDRLGFKKIKQQTVFSIEL